MALSLQEEVRAHLPGHPHAHRRKGDTSEVAPERLEHIRIFAALATGSMQPEEPPRGRRVADVGAAESVEGRPPPVPGKRVRRLPEASPPGVTPQG